MDSKERKKLHRWEQKNRWMVHYELKYGVLPIEYGPPVVGTGASNTPTTTTAVDATPTVLKAKCRFCECFGREAPSADYLATKAVAAAAAAAAGIEFPGSPMASSGEGGAALDENSSNADDTNGGTGHGSLKRRKKRQTLKVFGPNFRTDNLESHLTREHPIKWKEYERLRDADKKVFFPDGPSDLAASAKELLLAQQVAAAANAAAAMNMATRNALAGATVGHPNGSNGMLLHPTANLKMTGTAVLSNTGVSPIKHMASTEIMAMVEQLLTSPVLRRHQATTLQHEASTTASTASVSVWQSFVREDETLADAAATLGGVSGDSEAAATAVAGSTLTGDCKIVSSEWCTISLQHDALFLYLVDVFSARQSLDTTLAMVHAAQCLVPDAAVMLTNLTLTDVAGAVHQLVGLNLSCLSQLLSCAWGYALFLRFVTYHNTGFVDVRVQVPVNDEIHDFHVVSLPLEASKHSVDALGAAMLKALTVVDARAVEKLVGLTIDGDHYHMHQYKDIGAWVQKQTHDATGHAAFYVLYSGVYHVSFIVDELLDHCQGDQHFLTTLADVEAMCRSTTTLRGLMGPAPTRFASAHWVSVFNACEWLTVHRETILKWASEHQPSVTLPSTQWWVTLFVLRDVLKDVYAAFKKCRERSGSLADVQKHLRDLVFQLRLKFNIKPTMSSDAGGDVAGVASSATAADLAVDLAAAAAAATSTGSSPPTATAAGASSTTRTTTTTAEVASHLDPCEFSYQDFVSFVIPLDLFMYEAFQLKSIDGITDDDRVALYQRFHLVLMLLVNKVLAVINSSPESPVPVPSSSSDSDPTTSSPHSASPDSSPHQYAMQIPPSIPYDFITMHNVAAMDVLNQQRFRIRAKWTGKALAMITDDRNRMIAEFAQPSALYEAATNGAKLHQSGHFQFREVWKPFAVEYASLASFASVFGGLLSVTRTTEDELAYYFYGMHQYAAPTLTLEAQLHAAQFHKLMALRRHGDATIV